MNTHNKHSGHDHKHSHNDHAGHSHEHGHSHAPASYGKAFAIGTTINIIFIIAEVIYGLKANSLSLLADAGHNASDVLGLFLAWGAIYLSTRKPTERYTYGLKSSSIVASLGNTVLILLAVGAIALESINRLSHPEAISGYTVIIVAAIGVLINGFTAYLLMSGSKNDINIKAAFIHFAGDAAISLGVVLTGFIILNTGWNWLDPATSIIISLLIIYSTWGLLKDSLNLSLHAVPSGIELTKVKIFLSEQSGVKEVHDLHIWAMSTTEIALTAHLVMKNGHPGDDFISKVTHDLEHKFNINHSTIQIEVGDSAKECNLAPDNIV